MKSKRKTAIRDSKKFKTLNSKKHQDQVLKRVMTGRW